MFLKHYFVMKHRGSFLLKYKQSFTLSLLSAWGSCGQPISQLTGSSGHTGLLWIRSHPDDIFIQYLYNKSAKESIFYQIVLGVITYFMVISVYKFNDDLYFLWCMHKSGPFFSLVILIVLCYSDQHMPQQIYEHFLITI